MTSLKEAVKIASEAVEDLFGAQGISNVMLEEVEATSDEFWKVTIGFDRPADAGNGATHGLSAGLLSMARRRKYKVVQVRKTDGEVLSVKDRQFE
jgi:hypothetical protein